MTLSNLTDQLSYNAKFAEREEHREVPEIPFVPFKQLYVITCIDPRVEPAAILGLGLGDAVVARNLGGRVTPALIKDLAWVMHLHENKTPDAEWFDIAVIHHTDCGSGLLADDELRAGYVTRGGWDDYTARHLAVLEPAATVRADVSKLLEAPELRPGIENVRVGGYTYDLATGLITTVVAPA
jgi:carbonic anhydrase